MGYWEYSIIALCLLLAAFTAWQEYKRPNRRNMRLRISAVVLTVISLACLALPVAITKNAAQSNGEAIILTQGWNRDSIARFLAGRGNNMPAYNVDDYISAKQSKAGTLHVFGYGLSEEELHALKVEQIIFHPSAIPTGISTADWKHVLQKGEVLRVQGSFTNTSTLKIKLVLSGLNTPFDSVEVQPARKSNFELNCVPKSNGKAVYALTAIEDGKVIEKEPIPFEVAQPDSLAVLALAASPDFENRFLKNWLTQNGFSVAMRTTISKGKSGDAFANTAKADLNHITAQMLDKFDAVITDASAFSALGRDEQNSIQYKTGHGLGLIVKADTLTASAFFSPLFGTYSPVSNIKKISVHLAGEKKWNSLVTDQPVYIKSAPSIQTIVEDSAAQALTAIGLYGAGRIALTTLNNTYTWALSGDSTVYGNYWGALISRVARRKTPPAAISFNQPFIQVNQPVLVNIETAASGIPGVVIDSSNIYCKQNPALPFLWQGTYWSRHKGWQNIAVNDGARQAFYVYDIAVWQTARFIRRIKATRLFEQQHTDKPAVATTGLFTPKAPVPKAWFLLLLVICCTVLWVERKFNG